MHSLASLARRAAGLPSPPQTAAAYDLLPTLETRLASAEAAIPELEKQRRPLLLDADAGLPGAPEELARAGPPPGSREAGSC